MDFILWHKPAGMYATFSPNINDEIGVLKKVMPQFLGFFTFHITDLRDEHSQKVMYPILVTFSGNVIAVRDLHSSKVPSAINRV